VSALFKKLNYSSYKYYVNRMFNALL